VYREELWGLLYPTLVHLVLDLIEGDRGDGSKARPAERAITDSRMAVLTDLVIGHG
jgi:hypothetical protein